MNSIMLVQYYNQMIKTINVKQAGNKKDKFHISMRELHAHTPEQYRELVGVPREEIALGKSQLSLKFQANYEMARSRMQKRVKAMASL